MPFFINHKSTRFLLGGGSLNKIELSKTDGCKRRIQTQQEIDQFLIKIQIEMCLTQIIVIVIDI